MEGGPDPRKQIYEPFLNAKGGTGEINNWPPSSNLQPTKVLPSQAGLFCFPSKPGWNQPV